MKTIKKNHTGAAVEDVQQRLALAGCLQPEEVDGVFGDATAAAVAEFCRRSGLPETEEVTTKVWSTLVDASFTLGDRTLYLRMPYMHGHDVLQLQQALSALGFSYGHVDGIFGAHTEEALRKFQLNMGLPDDGIAGSYTFAAVRNLSHSWEGKAGVKEPTHMGFARAASVLGSYPLCLFGTNDFTRSVASRMANLSLATNPASKFTSADILKVAPGEGMLMVHLVLPEEEVNGIPVVLFEDLDTMHLRLRAAVHVVQRQKHPRIAVRIPGTSWEGAGFERSAQHFAISLLDALCQAFDGDYSE